MKTEPVRQQTTKDSGTAAVVCYGDGEDDDGEDGEQGQDRDLESDKGSQQQDKGRTDFGGVLLPQQVASRPAGASVSLKQLRRILY